VANEENDFGKLLRDAPMASDADTVTVVGILARTPDAARFRLTLPDGRSEMLDVAAVKSAKTIAGAIGQSVVQLELDAKRIPESVRDAHRLMYLTHHKPPQVDFNKPPSSELTTGVAEQPHTGPFDNIGGTAGPGADIYSPGTGGVALGGAGGSPAWFAPFVAAMPHQADPATIEALALYGTRTYFNAYVWASDHHTVLKPRLDQP
jgi:hypothetical protein